MSEEASETERRGTEIIDGMEGCKTAILEKATETKAKASEMLKTYIDGDSDALDGFEFMTIAEAGEVGHWKVLQVMAQAAGEQKIIDLTGWALPIQERHLSETEAGSLKLTSQTPPS